LKIYGHQGADRHQGAVSMKLL